MIPSTDPLIANHAIWRGWVQKGKLSKHSTVVDSRVVAGILLVLGIGMAIYLHTMK
jgi:hypothetical protein